MRDPLEDRLQLADRLSRCDACEQEEIDRAYACMKAEDEADAKGEPYDCPCGPVPECTHGAAS